MGRAKRTRKYAATKRVLNPNDGRLKLKAAAKADAAPIIHRESDKKKGAADAAVQRSELFFSHNRALGPPFHVRSGGGLRLGGGQRRRGGGWVWGRSLGRVLAGCAVRWAACLRGCGCGPCHGARPLCHVGASPTRAAGGGVVVGQRADAVGFLVSLVWL